MMSTIRVFSPSLATGKLVLSSEESHHLIEVLRARPGLMIRLFDGAGHEGRGVVTSVERRRAVVEVSEIEHQPFELAHRVTLAVAAGKQHRHAYLIEKCTELGVAALWPLDTARSVTHPGEATVEKWRRRAIEASKQSGRAWVPEVAPLRRVDGVIGLARTFRAAAMCDVVESGLSVYEFLEAVPTPADVLFLVGPEGGWTDEERSTAANAGLAFVRLAPTTLRTETAAVAVCAAAAVIALE